MLIPSEDQIVQRLSELLAGTIEHDVSQMPLSQSKPGAVRVRAGSHCFVVEPKTSSAAAPVAGAIAQLRKYPLSSEGLIPVVAVPYMGDVGRNLCESAGVSWIDLSGNAHLNAPGLLVHIEGRPNLFKVRGRPSDVFAPMSSRITRSLLANYASSWSVRGLASRTKMDPGFTSRILSRLKEQGLVTLHTRSDSVGALRNPGLLLNAWRDEYKFLRHDVLEGHVPARSGDELLRDLDKSLTKARIEHAATGLGAAWAFTHFATFRLVTFYVRERPDTFLSDVGFRADPRGANVWLVVPNDAGVFQEMHPPRWYDPAATGELSDLMCVHPVQIYVDLKDHPERAAEAAAELRSRILGW
jgi:hypothetical protein